MDNWIIDGFRINMLDDVDSINAKLTCIDSSEFDEYNMVTDTCKFVSSGRIAKLNGLDCCKKVHPEFHEGDSCVSIVSYNKRKNSGYDIKKSESKSDLQYVRFEFGEYEHASRKEGNVYITNSFSQKMFDFDNEDSFCVNFSVMDPVDFEEVKPSACSYVGHKFIADRIGVKVNRKNLKLVRGDTVICATKELIMKENGKKVWNGQYKFIKVEVL